MRTDPTLLTATMDRPALSAYFRTVLIRAQAERSARRMWVKTETGTELGWVAYERAVALRAANRARSDRGLSAMAESEVVRVENLAAGHIDYTAKWAWGLAGLVLDTPNPGHAEPRL